MTTLGLAGYPLSEEAYNDFNKLYKFLKKDKRTMSSILSHMGHTRGMAPFMKQRIFCLGWLLSKEGKFELMFEKDPSQRSRYVLFYWIEKRGYD